jgi:hypothetical protein
VKYERKNRLSPPPYNNEMAYFFPLPEYCQEKKSSINLNNIMFRISYLNTMPRSH